ncbi:hypothetical protein SPHFLASMR4Y_01112 [Sphingorhabdus sp. SMR4y]|nr:hypothetical protein SPHFLASMR4Y_01112 [Sphingorhabdus sp. SMR4y]
MGWGLFMNREFNPNPSILSLSKDVVRKPCFDKLSTNGIGNRKPI